MVDRGRRLRRARADELRLLLLLLLPPTFLRQVLCFLGVRRRTMLAWVVFLGWHRSPRCLLKEGRRGRKWVARGDRRR